MEQQLKHHENKFEQQKKPIIILAHHVQSPANVGGLFRLADAFAVKELILPESINLNSTRLKRNARATIANVKHHCIKDSIAYLENLQQNNYQIICLEITKNSTPLEALRLVPTQPIVLVIGDERLGIPENILNRFCTHVHIPMYGKNSSMNVTQATAIALYEICKQI